MAVNANHAMNGSGTLTISLNQIQPEHLPGQLGLAEREYVHLAIADDGCGMTEQVRKRIFEPYFTTKGEQGSGLGLAQAYGMIQRCGGAITVDSVQGQGSCFHIYLPVTELLAATPVTAVNTKMRPPVTAALASVAKGSRQSEHQITILLVDDEEELLEMHALLLESAGYLVCKARSAAEALTVLQSQSVQLLLSDIMMPQMNGLELAKRIQADFPAVKIQLISGFADSSLVFDEDSKRWYEQRLTKPVPMTTLLQRVDSLVCAT
jgi:CheY-like chemotaxis protein